MRHAFLCSPVRTPIGRFAGGLSPCAPTIWRAAAWRAVGAQSAARLELWMTSSGLCEPAGKTTATSRACAAAGGASGAGAAPPSTALWFGLQAVLDAAARIRAGDAEILIAGGVRHVAPPYVGRKSRRRFAASQPLEDTTWVRFINPHARGLRIETMPETAEDVAAEDHIPRADPDCVVRALAPARRRRQRARRLAREIEPVTGKIKKATSSVATTSRFAPTLPGSALQAARTVFVRPAR